MRRMSPSSQARRSSEIVARGILVHLRGRAVPRVNHVPGALAMVPLHLLAAALLVLLHDRSSWLCCRCGVTVRGQRGLCSRITVRCCWRAKCKAVVWQHCSPRRTKAKYFFSEIRDT